MISSKSQTVLNDMQRRGAWIVRSVKTGDKYDGTFDVVLYYGVGHYQSIDGWVFDQPERDRLIRLVGEERSPDGRFRLLTYRAIEHR